MFPPEFFSILTATGITAAAAPEKSRGFSGIWKSEKSSEEEILAAYNDTVNEEMEYVGNDAGMYGAVRMILNK